MADKLNLNLGCGALIYKEFINVDFYQGPGIDLVWDLDNFPWPWEDESMEFILALDIYEHVNKPVEFVNEIWRILQPGGSVRLRTTYWKTKQSYTDPTHKRWLTENSFDYWIKGTEFHQKYGRGYSGGRHFDLNRVWLDGNELEWQLIKRGRCSGSC